MVTAQGGAAIVPAVIGGQVQFGFSNMTTLMIAQVNRVPVKAVANGLATTGEQGADFAGLAVPKGSPITSAKELAGRKVAINTLKNIGDTSVRESVRKAGGDPAEVDFVPWTRVGENVELPLRRRKSLDRGRRAELVADALAAVGLAGTDSACPWQLSGGTQQRVAIARALAYGPEVPLMDEPFAAVDALTRAELEDLVRGLWRERGMTILFATHDIDEAV